MSEWSEERRRNKAADAEQHRLDADAAMERRLRARELAGQQRRQAVADDRAAGRADRLQRRRDRRDRRRERTAAWTRGTTPEVLYRRGTLALVTASALASLPAQVAHFAGISTMLLPLPVAIEGAAWVMAAGVAHADERGLPGWVRWLLRALCLSAAGFAGYINYGYGVGLPHLTGGQQHTAGIGLAAVSVLGPALFEVRQWVGTLTAAAVTPKEKAAAKATARATRDHLSARQAHHAEVCALADRLISAAPIGSLSPEDAFLSAWEIQHGTRLPGMTQELHTQAAASRVSLAKAVADAGRAEGDPEPEAVAVELFLAELFAPGGGEPNGGTARGGKPSAPTSGGSGGTTVTAAKKETGNAQLSAHLSARKKPVPPRRRKGDSQPFSAVAKKAASNEARARQDDQQ